MPRHLGHIATAATGAIVGFVVVVGVLAVIRFALLDRPASTVDDTTSAASDPYTGSPECRSCHERFYELWAPSHHGLAMQPYTDAFAAANLTPQAKPMTIEGTAYQAHVGPGEGYVEQPSDGEPKHFPIEHALGGKNVYYFLTPMERGKLQVLPVAYDARRSAWFDTTASAVRHFTDRTDEAIDWRDRALTFNTSCYGCHVSQLSTNYDLSTDTYRTTWAEPGINCETCHGPGGEHVRVCREAPEGQPPDDLKIIVTKDFTAEQMNSMCAPCHAKMIPLSASFMPGERYVDHYDLVALEHSDFYPDGRDLGENYTYTTWRLSPCVQAGGFDCAHCHTSSGRYRFADEAKANHACLPCHKQHVDNPTAHSHHEADSEGNRCIACHMPMTEFARMMRSDHSMRAPMPAATIRFKSPNGCNLCHDDKSAEWADQWVRKWYSRDYQKPVLAWAQLVDDARRNRWKRLDDMLAYIADETNEEIVTVSLIRLLRGCDDARKWPVLVKALKNPSALVRGAAAEVLGERRTPDVVAALIEAASDKARLVRIRAGGSLAGVPPESIPLAKRQAYHRALEDFESSMHARPDDPTSHYNLGNFYMSRNRLDRAIDEYEISSRLHPEFTPPLVNASITYNMLGNNERAEAALRSALAHDPNCVAAHLNLGLLMGEMRRIAEARRSFERTLELDPNNPVAAYNLGVLLAQDDLGQAVHWCRVAHRAIPADPKYAYTLAFYLRAAKQPDKASDVLRGLLERQPGYTDASLLLGQILEEQGKRGEARDVYTQAYEVAPQDPRLRAHLVQKIQALSGR